MWSIGYSLDVLGTEFQLHHACFYNPTAARKFGPLMEFLSDNNPPIYRETHFYEYAAPAHFGSKGLDGNSALAHFKI